MEPTNEIELCALCLNEQPLRTSHVLPAFAFRWLRETSATGHIRSGEAPNKRVQDGMKLPLLCQDCETLFSSFETAFSSRVFYPYTENPKRPYAYENWMLKFCVSISWRVLESARRRGKLHSLSDQYTPYVMNALQAWREFLISSSPHPGEFEQHLLPLYLVDRSTNIPNMPTNINRYFMRCIDIDIAYSGAVIFTYAKLGPFVIMGLVKNPKEKWVGTKVHLRFGSVSARRFELPLGLMNYIFDRARNYQSIYEQVSDAQWERIDQTIMSNLDRVSASQEFEAMAQDALLFGEQVVIRSPKD